MKRVLVTGASSGIGMELTKKLGQHGHHVVALARRKEKMDISFKDVPTVTPIAFDVCNISGIPGLIKEISETFGPPSILVNNAGYSVRAAIEEVPQIEVQKMFDVNFMSALAFIQAVLPYMRNEKNGLIINVSSVVGRVAIPFNGIYSATKYALEAISDCLRIELQPWKIKVVLVEPGPVHTEFAAASEELSKYLLTAKNTPYEKYYIPLMGKVDKFNQKAVSASFAADIIFKIIESESPKARYPVHWIAYVMPFLRNFVPSRLTDYLLAKYHRIR
ncbi:MAG: hypothetical protein A2161_12860 [Candidatus Schekmanbacteria bacterium RBG_13_48_7]|uniref:Short-chain dehydrogenase/reductase n=1 Tax=Candidatus Schekmanbacteria bacterium RBG_13_48_7 TaxID=1817878 RepID=A0A1F7S2Y7_9BACT|nr:MAG: hypothetical protein A2161_12860 [Candidatus Schekmanbacteria bacterium RBG_13_48_7]